MAYLVTGGTGYIGSYVVRDLLNRGKKVVCLQRSGVTPVAQMVIGEDNLSRIKIIQGDVSDTLQLFDIVKEQGIDLIVHLAYIMPPLSELKPAYAFRINCVGMNNVLEAARLFGLKRVIWLSTQRARVEGVYRDPVVDSEVVYAPTYMYGATKAINEAMAMHYFAQFGTDSIGFRVASVYGIGRWHGRVARQMEFFRRAALNILDTMGDADQTRDYVYVEDVSDIIARACDVPTTNTRIFDLVEGRYSNRQIVETIRRINPQAQVTVENREEQPKAFWLPRLDATDVRTELGWQPKYSLEEGLRKVLNYFRRQEGLPLLCAS